MTPQDGGMVAGVADRLTCESSRRLLAALERFRGPDGIIRRHAFGPEDLWPWLGGIAINQWSEQRGDYVYRLFGTHLAENLGRDLTGLTFGEWPDPVARIMRDQADLVRRTGAVVVSHYRLKVIERDGRIEDRVQTQEKVVVAIAYAAEGPPDAVLVHVDQTRGDLSVLHAHMNATDGSCWCVAGGPVDEGCPIAPRPRSA